MKRAGRLLNMPSYPFARWTAYVDTTRQQGVDVIRLDIGNPDTPPPNEVVEALCQSARQEVRFPRCDLQRGKQTMEVDDEYSFAF